MAKRKPRATQATPRKDFQKDLSKLKKAGVIPAGVDVRKAQNTKHYRGLINKFADTITGKADVVNVPRGKGKEYREKFAVKGNHVQVPKPQLGGKAKYNKKSGEIEVTARVPGGVVKSRYGVYSETELKKMEGKGVSFSIAVDRGMFYEVHRKQTVAELSGIFQDGSFNNFAKWTNYVNVEQYTGDVDFDMPQEVRKTDGERAPKFHKAHRQRKRNSNRRR